MKKISVIIPCYNVEKYISVCLNSLSRQTIGIQNLEIILINDCSTDNTLSLLLNFEREYPNSVIVIPLDHNIKQGGARNVGLKYATGEYIVFLDGDDWIEDSFYEELYDIAKKYNVDIIQYSFKNVITDSQNKIIAEKNDYSSTQFGLHQIENISQRKIFLNSNILNYGSQSKFYNGEFIRKYTPTFLEGVIYEEPSFVYPLLYKVNKVFVYEKTKYICRRHDESTMKSYAKQKGKLYDHPKVQLYVYKIMRDDEFIYKTYHEEIDYYFLFTFFLETLAFSKLDNLYFGYDFFSIMKEIFQELNIDWTNNTYIRNGTNGLYWLLNQICQINSEEEFELLLNTLTIN